jgi:hypothetical protein
LRNAHATAKNEASRSGWPFVIADRASAILILLLAAVLTLTVAAVLILTIAGVLAAFPFASLCPIAILFSLTRLTHVARALFIPLIRLVALTALILVALVVCHGLPPSASWPKRDGSEKAFRELMSFKRVAHRQRKIRGHEFDPATDR